MRIIVIRCRIETDAGNAVSVTNPRNQTTTIGRNVAGQPISITDPLNNSAQLSYDFGDPRLTTDPLGNTSTRFTDDRRQSVQYFSSIGQSGALRL